MDLHPSLKKYIKYLKGEKPEARPVKLAPLDPPLRYSDFQASTGIKTCCRVMLHSFKCNITRIHYSFKKPFEGIYEFTIEIKCCPSCGRKLK